MESRLGHDFSGVKVHEGAQAADAAKSVQAQAFTVGERWPVREERIAALLENGQITPEQAERFRTEGAIGSHLENLERNEGFKGFNQTGVSEIIARTDPRKN